MLLPLDKSVATENAENEMAFITTCLVQLIEEELVFMKMKKPDRLLSKEGWAKHDMLCVHSRSSYL